MAAKSTDQFQNNQYYIEAGDFGDSDVSGISLATGPDGRGPAEANLGLPSDASVVYDISLDEDGGSNTYVTLARVLTGEAFNIGQGRGRVDDGSSQRGVQGVVNDENNPRLRSPFENGGLPGYGHRYRDSLNAENLARQRAGMPLRPIPDPEAAAAQGPGLAIPKVSGSEDFKGDTVIVNATDKNKVKRP
ncbi:MAG: hypothetical protein IPN69_14565 [Acidobacteria bacterium]|nr:hypothetical protein [Acidobacteriota bacterium]